MDAARNNFYSFCEYVIKDESTGKGIKLAEIQKSWIKHIAFCKKHKLNCLILAPMGSGKCVDPETPVLTDTGYKAAEDLEVGEKVLSMNEDNVPQWKPVVAKENFVKNCVKVRFKSGRELVVSHDHPFATTEGWTEAQDLRPKKDKVKTVTNYSYQKPAQVYDKMDAYMLGVILGKDYDFEGTGNGNTQFISKFCDKHGFELNIDKFRSFTPYRLDIFKQIVEKLNLCEADFLQTVSIHDRVTVRYFLRGYYDVIGRYNRRSKFIYMNTASTYVAQGLQHMLQYVGIESKVANMVIAAKQEDSSTQQEVNADSSARDQDAGDKSGTKVAKGDATSSDDGAKTGPNIQVSRTPAVCLTDNQVRDFVRVLEIA